MNILFKTIVQCVHRSLELPPSVCHVWSVDLLKEMLIKTLPAGLVFLRLKTLNRRSRFAIRLTELWDMPVTFWISQGLLLVPGLFSWLHISSETREIFCCVPTDRGRPLPTFRSTEPVLLIFHKRLLTELTTPLFWRNSEQIPLATHHFLPKKFNQTFFFIREWHIS